MLPYSRVIKGLDSRKVRKKEGLFLIEGPRILEEALAADLVLKAVYADQAKTEANRALLDAASQKTQVFEVPSDEFLQLSDTVTPQGVLAVAQCPEHDLWDLTTEPFFLVLDGIQDPGNLGTLFRTAVASGCGGIVLLKNTADPYNPKVVRSTMGAMFKIPFAVDVLPDDLFRFVREKGAFLWAATLKDAKPYYGLTPKTGIGIVIGNEGAGISREIAQKCDEKVYIPIDDRAESLNAGIAAGVLLFHLRKELV
jgi:TrmH family RNA methyltransferase